MVHVCTEAGEDTSIEEDILNCSFMVAMLPLAGTVPTPHDVLNSPTYQGAKDEKITRSYAHITCYDATRK
jgi:hypothetical protein